MTAIIELIHRLEAADSAAYILDEAVHEVRFGDFRYADLANGHPRPYTASLDAALALIDPAHYWIVAKGRTRPDEPLYGAQIKCAETDEVLGEGESNASPALALCIAALKARTANTHSTSEPK